MATRLRNHSLMKRVNRTRVLNALRVNTQVSRAQLADHTGLDRKSVTNVINDLTADGLVEESGEKIPSRGRAHSLLQIPTRNQTIGIVVEPDGARGVLVDFYGATIAREHRYYAGDSPRGEIVGAIREVTEQLASQAGELHGIGVAIHSAVSTMERAVVHSANIPGLYGARFDEILKWEDCGVYFENDANAIALAEKWFGQGQRHQNFAAINVGYGVGAGLIINRRLFKGTAHSAGEIGHVVVKPDGNLCGCGNRGCLEAHISRDVVLTEARQAIQQDDLQLDALPADDPKLRKIIADGGYHLGRATASLVNLLNPTAVILSGPLLQYQDLMWPEIWRALRAECVTPCLNHLELLKSNLEDAPALGAATLALSGQLEVEDVFYV